MNERSRGRSTSGTEAGALFSSLGRPTDYDPDDLIAVARLCRPHGLRGEVSCVLLTDFPERFSTTSELYLIPPQGAPRLVPLASSRLHGERVLLRFAGVDRVEEADLLRDCTAAVAPDETVALAPGEFYHYELEGLEVYDAQGNHLGQLDSVMATPAHEIYVVAHADGELLIPAVPEFIVSIDVEGARMVVHPPVPAED